MKQKLTQPRYLAITIVLTLLIIANLHLWQNIFIGIILGTLYLLFYSYIAGTAMREKSGWQLLLGFLTITSAITIAGAGALYFFELTNVAYTLIIILLPAILFIPYFQKPNDSFGKKLKDRALEYFDGFTARKEKKASIILVFIYLALAFTAFNTLAQHQVTVSIQSPFQAVTPRFFLLYFVATLILVIYLASAKRGKLPLSLVVIHVFLSTSVAALIYKLGYGFDPFIHQQAEKIITETGTITPKTFYYLGQYGLVFFLHKLTFISIETIDRWLVPMVTAVTLPVSAYYLLKNWISKNHAFLLSLFVIIIPFSGFIMTTPQNLANLFFIITIFLSVTYLQRKTNFTLILLLTLATIAIHPLAGVPLAITVFLVVLFKKMYAQYHRNLLVYFLTAAILLCILPLAFLANGSGLQLKTTVIALNELIPFTWVNHFDVFLNSAYLFSFNATVLAIILITVGTWVIYKHKLLRNYAPYFAAAAVILSNYILFKYVLDFSELRDFDQHDFVKRMLTLTFYILLPLFLIGSHHVLATLWSKDAYVKTFTVLGVTCLITIAFYLSYPQVNQYVPAKFFSLSQSDIKAVTLIEQIAAPEHVVLANQMVGVASIKEFGFKKYYKGQFYYSMPNGATTTLYDHYLDMIYQDHHLETMYNAMHDAGVDEAYFVLNSYWRDAEKIAARVSQTAEQIYTIDDGAVLIFKYSKNQ